MAVRDSADNAPTNVPAPGSKRRVVPARPKAVPQDAEDPPTMARCPMPPDLLPDLVTGLAGLLGATTYALMGGIALRLLGQTRRTSDIDIFVPGGSGQLAKKFADSNSVHFGAHKARRSRAIIWYRGLDGHRYRVYFWEPQQIGHPFPPSAVGIIMISGVRVLKPALLLDHKCKCWTEHAECGDQAMVKRDGGDIMFLLGYMGNRRLCATQREVPNATPEFFGKFLAFKRESEAMFCTVALLKPRETTVTRGSQQRTTDTTARGSSVP